MTPKEESQHRYSMSWEDVVRAFPYGLPASLRREEASNVIDLDEKRRRKREQQERA
jgi:hypothetical protein